MQNGSSPAHAAELLASYGEATPFFFASPTRALSAQRAGRPIGSAASLAPAEEARAAGAAPAARAARDATLIEQVERALRAARERQATRPMVVGALPFAPGRAARLALHEEVAIGAALPDRSQEEARGPAQRARSVRMHPTPSGYEGAVEHALASIARGELRKVVLARALDFECDGALDVPALLRRLAAQNPNKYVFSCDVSEPGGERRTFLGASPELLIEKHGSHVSSHPLAGSTPRSSDPGEDAARAEALARCPKNLAEHALVVDAVASALTPYCRQLHVPRAPALVQTATMWHLGTRIAGELHDASVSSFALALALHPTPAVCGAPSERARTTIEALEGFDRGYFAGAVGYCDAQGDGEWAVAIRCAEASERSLRLYAGAGIVAGSTPRAELDETTAKLDTMLRALRIEHLRQVL